MKKKITVIKLLERIKERKDLPTEIKIYNNLYKIYKTGDSIDYVTENGNYLIDDILKYNNLLSDVLNVECELI